MTSGRGGGVPGDRAGAPAARVYLLRALALRCPNCGSGGLFRRWVQMRAECPGCQLLLDRGERDYFIGAYTLNFIAAEVAIVLVAAAVGVATWPHVPWSAIQWGLAGLMIPFPVFTYPFSKTVWLAVDLLFRPLTRGDFAGHGENG
jgi:uncharacterized protein (DUF983 family)